jgi:hypothetical protein
LSKSKKGQGWKPVCPDSRDGCLPLSVSKIFEICGDAKVAAADELNHCLQIVFLLSRNSNLSILQLALYFETL